MSFHSPNQISTVDSGFFFCSAVGRAVRALYASICMSMLCMYKWYRIRHGMVSMVYGKAFLRSDPSPILSIHGLVVHTTALFVRLKRACVHFWCAYIDLRGVRCTYTRLFGTYIDWEACIACRL